MSLLEAKDNFEADMEMRFNKALDDEQEGEGLDKQKEQQEGDQKQEGQEEDKQNNPKKPEKETMTEEDL